MSAGEVRDFLARHGLAANRDLGQNFLVESGLAERLVELSPRNPEARRLLESLGPNR